MPDVGASPLIKLSIVRKRHGGITQGLGAEAVLDLTLAVWPGEILCMVGPSGCGKTTTLRILLGLDRDYEGRVEPDPDSLAMRIMFQEPRLLPWRTVEENVRIVLPPKRRQDDLGPLLADVGVEPWRNHYPGALSLGLARRAALARALADPPKLLVLDEPFVSLDEQAAADLCRVVVSRAERDAMAVLVVTHNIREAISIADRIVVLSRRPARVIGEVALERERGDRPPDWVERQRHTLTERFSTIA